MPRNYWYIVLATLTILFALPKIQPSKLTRFATMGTQGGKNKKKRVLHLFLLLIIRI